MAAARVLLIESPRAKRSSFAAALSRRYAVTVATSGKQALALAAAQPPDMVVLDAISMRTPGDRICDQLRAGLPHIALIHLHPGPKSSVASSADSVLTPSFTARKLINTIERLLQVDNDDIVSCGPFSVNVGRRVLIAHGQETQLTPKLALLVQMFLRRPGEILDRKTLMNEVWHTDYMGDTRTLDVHIRWFRKVIEPDPNTPIYLKTIRGVGYQFAVQRETPTETDSHRLPFATAEPTPVLIAH